MAATMVTSPRIRLFLAMITFNFIFTILLFRSHLNTSNPIQGRKYTDISFYTYNVSDVLSGTGPSTMAMVVRTEKSVSISERREKVRVSVSERQSSLSSPVKEDLFSTSKEPTVSVFHEQKNNINALRFDEMQGQFDPPHKFKTHPFVVVADDWNSISRRKACLATQTSLDRSHWLMNLSSTWTGPISVSLFTPDIEFDLAVRYITYLRQCYPRIRNRVSFHFTYPVQYPPKFLSGRNGLSSDQTSCEDHEMVLKNLLTRRTKSMLSWRESFPYPQNLLRNVARHNCPTEYILCPDVDMVPVQNLDLDLEDFLSRLDIQECRKCAYVIPVYEIKDTSDVIPRNKTELITLVKKKLARRFHVQVFDQNQKKSNLVLWEKKAQGPVLDVVYDVKNYSFFYEPVYVAKADVPPFDERFVGFGMTRNTQVYEMFLADYKFQVLNNAFLIHWGFQTVTGRPSWRNKQIGNNFKLFRDFIREISVKYDKDPLNLLSKHTKHLKRAISLMVNENKSTSGTKNNVKNSVKKSVKEDKAKTQEKSKKKDEPQIEQRTTTR